MAKSIWDRINERASRPRGEKATALETLFPHLAGREHLLRIASDEEGPSSAAQGYGGAAGLYAVHTWVNKAVRIIADNIAPLPVLVYRDETPLETHPLNQVLADPNPEQSGADLWKQWCTDMLLGGEAGIELALAGRQVAELWPRQPDQVTVIADAARQRYYGVAGYRVRIHSTDRGFELPPEEFVFTKFYNPQNPWRGLSPVAAIRKGVAIDQLAQAWSYAFFRNSARPDYAVVTRQGVSRSERDDLEKQLQAKFGGAEQSHKPVILEEGMTDIKPLQFRPVDMEWLTQREFSRDEVGGVYGVPDELMGYGKDTYENIANARQMLWTLTLLPIVGLRDSKMTKHFRRHGYLRPGESIRTDLSGVPELQADLGERVQIAVNLTTLGYTTDQVNERLGLGMPDAPEPPPPPPPPETPTAPAEDTPPAGEPPPDAPEGPAPRGMIAPVKGEDSESKGTPYGSEKHLARLKNVGDQVDRRAQDMQPLLEREFERQHDALVATVRAWQELAAGDAITKALFEDLFDTLAEAAAFVAAFRGLIGEAVLGAAQADDAEYGLGTDMRIESPQVQAGIELVLNEMASKVNDTTYRDLTGLFRAAEAEGLGTDDIIERLDAYFEGRRSAASLERIARTTMTGAAGAGQTAVYLASEVVVGVEWLSAYDARTRDAHAEAHGQVVDPGDSFEVGGEKLRYPGDPRASPGNTINCRCAVAPMIKE